MKHIQLFESFGLTNELFGIGSKIRKAFNKDESIAEHIYKSLNSRLYIELSKTKKEGTYDNFHYSFYYSYKANIDGFNIKSSYITNRPPSNAREYTFEEYGPHHGYDSWYRLYIDNDVVQCSEHISKKIWEKLDNIYKSEKSGVQDYKKSYNIK